jgi:hypothetical protein
MCSRKFDRADELQTNLMHDRFPLRALIKLVQLNCHNNFLFNIEGYAPDDRAVSICAPQIGGVDEGSPFAQA